MKFFMPYVQEDKLEVSHDALRQHARNTLKIATTDKHVYALDYVHDGQADRAEVGEADRSTGELIVAVLEAKDVFLICTPKHGVLGGDPMMVGKDEVRSVTYFDS